MVRSFIGSFSIISLVCQGLLHPGSDVKKADDNLLGSVGGGGRKGIEAVCH